MQQLENTTLHLVRCIKPNSKQLPRMYEKDLVLQQQRCCGVLEVVRISRSGYPTRMTHQEFASRYGFVLSEDTVSQDPLSISVAVLQHFNILPDMYQVGFTKLYFRTGQIGALEDMRKQVLQGILRVQKCLRGHQARRYFDDIKSVVITLQSFVRGENVRREYGVLSKMKEQGYPNTLDEQQRAIIQLQSVIRGWLARKHYNYMKNSKNSNHGKGHSRKRSSRRNSEVKDLPQELVQVQPSVLEELQRRVMKAEATLSQKEEENIALREQVKQYEGRWSEYESKMKSMEEMWQKQMQSLQTSLAAARKSLAADNSTGQAGRLDASPVPRYYDSEDNMSIGTQTGGSTPLKFSNSAGREVNGNLNSVSHLVKEFEHTQQIFDNDAKALVEVKPGQSASQVTPEEELRKLKHRFVVWKKDYKTRLRETKAKLHKHGHSETERRRRKWWGKRITKAT